MTFKKPAFCVKIEAFRPLINDVKQVYNDEICISLTYAHALIIMCHTSNVLVHYKQLNNLNMGRIPQTKQREHVEPDSYPATCIGFYDLGTQQTSWKGKPKQSHLCRVAFEIDELETEEGEPFVYYKTYTFSSFPGSRFMKDLKAWLGVSDGDFDPDEMLGQPALITIEENEAKDGNVYMNIGAVTKLPKKMDIGEPREELVSLYLDETFDEEVYDELPEWIRNKIAESAEYKELMEPAAKKKAKKAKAKRDEEEEEEEEDERPAKRSSKNKKKTRHDDEEEEEEEEEDDDEEEEDEKPKRKPKVSGNPRHKKSRRDEENEEEEDDEEEEEEEEDERPKKRNAPARRTAEKSSKKKPVNAPARKGSGKTFRPSRK